MAFIYNMNIFIIILITSPLAVYFGRWLANVKIDKKKPFVAGGVEKPESGLEKASIDKYHIILGFTTGMIIMLAFGELLAESLEIPFWGSVSILFGLCLGWFLFKKHNHTNTHFVQPTTKHKFARIGGIFLHSTLDGFGFAVLYNLDQTLGLVSLVAFIAHRINDGFTGAVVLKRFPDGPRFTKRVAVMNALAPLVGVGLYYVLRNVVPYDYVSTVGAGLTFGFFFSLIRYELVPEILQDEHPVLPTLLAVLVGTLFMYLLISLQ